MNQPPPEKPQDDDNKRPLQEAAAEGEQFVLSTDNASKQGPKADPARSTSDYQPRQFDLDSLPDAESAESSVPESQAPQREAGRRSNAASSANISAQDTPPLGFVSEPRPVKSPSQSSQPAPRLGFLSADELEGGNEAGAIGIASASQADADNNKANSVAAEEEVITPPLGYVSEPVVVARQNVDNVANSAVASSEADTAAPELPPMDVAFEPPSVAVVPTEAEQSSEAAVRAQASTVSPPAVETVSEQGADSVSEDSQEEAAEPAAQSPGMMLRQARTEQGLTQNDIALRTQMPLEAVVALEEDRVPPQSAPIYVRGFYTRYARALGISDAPLLAAHTQANNTAPATEQKVGLELAPENVSPPSKWAKPVFVVVFSVFLGVFAWWGLPKINDFLSSDDTRQTADAALSTVKSSAAKLKAMSDDTADAALSTVKSSAVKLKDKSSELYERVEAEVQSVKARAAAEPGKAVSSAPKPAPSKPAPVVATPTQAPAVVVAEAAEPESPAVEESEVATEAAPTTGTETAQSSTSEAPAATDSTAEATAPAEPAVLVLDFTRQSWVSVTDANGLLLFEGMVEGDEQRQFEGETPMTLFLGTATAAKVTYGGVAVDIAAAMRSNGTARVQIGGE